MLYISKLQKNSILLYSISQIMGDTPSEEWGRNERFLGKTWQLLVQGGGGSGGNQQQLVALVAGEQQYLTLVYCTEENFGGNTCFTLAEDLINVYCGFQRQNIS